MLPKDYTKQENIIANELSEFGLRYDQQVPIDRYTADFYIAELGLIIEADGVYGHLRKRDATRDAEIMRIFGISHILHIKETTKETIREVLCRALENLEQNQ